MPPNLTREQHVRGQPSPIAHGFQFHRCIRNRASQSHCPQDSENLGVLNLHPVVAEALLMSREKSIVFKE
jgi:hypothetical protein